MGFMIGGLRVQRFKGSMVFDFGKITFPCKSPSKNRTIWGIFAGKI
jgi:hypothetical protein